ncbi:uncharacterized protein LOC112560727 [Pomacea canaliculata]|uniref:uncharacterized protein LOC112560727 n=1 Tax=Pomacea canaliculata TaxID=400727 RepID=UPI000D72F78A|nr:uncharacterized protein LOC112560727 [Pomacea canaliculata]
MNSFPLPSATQIFCFLSILLLISTRAVTSSTSPTSRQQESLAQKNTRMHWGPQHFLGWLPIRTRRSEMDNRLEMMGPSKSYDLSPEATALGESIMDEFIFFLTLKEAGVLDLCMQFK